MITKQEIRVGNWLNVVIANPEGEKLDVVGYVSKIKDDGIWLGSDGGIRIDLDDLFGIPVNNKALEKLGFKHNPIVLVSKQYLISLGRNRFLSVSDVGTPNEMVWLQNIEGRDVTDLVCIHNFDYDGEIYIHQLQNLYFALTGKELIFEL